MADKDTVELPRSLLVLREQMDALKRAVADKDKGRVGSLLQEFDQVRLRANAEMIAWSQQGRAMATLEEFSSTLNEAIRVRARGQYFFSQLGSF
jgi:hypothetical protein